MTGKRAILRDRLPRLGLGTAPIGDLYGPVLESTAVETVAAAIAGGITLIDTAPWYGLGLAERRVGLALQRVPRDSYQLSTKVGYLLNDDDVRVDFSPDGIRRSLDGSLARLGVDRIDIVHLHDPDHHERAAQDDALPVLVDLQAQGLIGAIGVGVNSWEMLMRLVHDPALDTFLLAGRYTLLEQHALPFLDVCGELGIPVELAGIFNSGILATGSRPGAKYNYVDADQQMLERVSAIAAVCAAFDVALPAAAMQFAMAHRAVATLIVGAASAAEVAANIRYLASPVPDALWKQLRNAGFLADAVPAPQHHRQTTIGENRD